jgi:uncharacterized membrane protein YhaH (DUF805 family)
VNDTRWDAQRAEQRLVDRRRQAVRIGALVGVVVGVIACIAMNRIYYGNTVRWGERSPLVDIVATIVFFPIVFTLNMSYTGMPLHDAPLPLLYLICLLLATLEGMAIGKLISLRYRARS